MKFFWILSCLAMAQDSTSSFKSTQSSFQRFHPQQQQEAHEQQKLRNVYAGFVGPIHQDEGSSRIVNEHSLKDISFLNSEVSSPQSAKHKARRRRPVPRDKDALRVSSKPRNTFETGLQTGQSDGILQKQARSPGNEGASVQGRITGDEMTISNESGSSGGVMSIGESQAFDDNSGITEGFRNAAAEDIRVGFGQKADKGNENSKQKTNGKLFPPTARIIADLNKSLVGVHDDAQTLANSAAKSANNMKEKVTKKLNARKEEEDEDDEDDDDDDADAEQTVSLHKTTGAESGFLTNSVHKDEEEEEEEEEEEDDEDEKIDDTTNSGSLGKTKNDAPSNVSTLISKLGLNKLKFTDKTKQENADNEDEYDNDAEEEEEEKKTSSFVEGVNTIKNKLGVNNVTNTVLSLFNVTSVTLQVQKAGANLGEKVGEKTLEVKEKVEEMARQVGNTVREVGVNIVADAKNLSSQAIDNMKIQRENLLTGGEILKLEGEKTLKHVGQEVENKIDEAIQKAKVVGAKIKNVTEKVVKAQEDNVSDAAQQVGNRSQTVLDSVKQIGEESLASGIQIEKTLTDKVKKNVDHHDNEADADDEDEDGNDDDDDMEKEETLVRKQKSAPTTFASSKGKISLKIEEEEDEESPHHEKPAVPLEALNYNKKAVTGEDDGVAEDHDEHHHSEIKKTIHSETLFLPLAEDTNVSGTTQQQAPELRTGQSDHFKFEADDVKSKIPLVVNSSKSSINSIVDSISKGPVYTAKQNVGEEKDDIEGHEKFTSLTAGEHAERQFDTNKIGPAAAQTLLKNEEKANNSRPLAKLVETLSAAVDKVSEMSKSQISGEAAFLQNLLANHANSTKSTNLSSDGSALAVILPKTPPMIEANSVDVLVSKVQSSDAVQFLEVAAQPAKSVTDQTSPRLEDQRKQQVSLLDEDKKVTWKRLDASDDRRGGFGWLVFFVLLVICAFGVLKFRRMSEKSKLAERADVAPLEEGLYSKGPRVVKNRKGKAN